MGGGIGTAEGGALGAGGDTAILQPGSRRGERNFPLPIDSARPGPSSRKIGAYKCEPTKYSLRDGQTIAHGMSGLETLWGIDHALRDPGPAAAGSGGAETL